MERAYLPRSIPAPEEPKREKENWTPREYWQTPEESKDDMTCFNFSSWAGGQLSCNELLSSNAADGVKLSPLVI